MKKFTLVASFLFALFSGLTASAQTFYMDKGDTSKLYWSAPGDMLVYNKIFNNTFSTINIQWRVINFGNTDANWICNGICDNIKCYTATPDITSGTSTQTTDDIGPKAYIADMHVIFNGDAAANNTWAWATISYKDPVSGEDTTATFAAYKNGTGLITPVKVNDDVTLFPNPAQNYIDVLYKSSSDVKTIAIYNIIGKLISVYKVSSNTSAHLEFNTEMPSGIYLMRIADSKGDIVATRKFTRQ